MKKMIPDHLTIDIRTFTKLDSRLGAAHLPKLRQFFREVIRCVQPCGRIACVEPYWGPLAQVIYRFGHTEDFDMSAERWEFDIHSPMNSNQGLLYLLLRKHRRVFEQEFPKIEMIEIWPLRVRVSSSRAEHPAKIFSQMKWPIG